MKGENETKAPVNTAVPASLEEFFGRWDTLAELVREVDLNYNTVRKMMERNKIASHHWQKFIKAAEAKGIPGISYEWFVKHS